MAMARPHLQALQRKKETLEEKIHRESTYAARNDQIIRRLKEEKLRLKEQIDRMQGSA